MTKMKTLTVNGVTYTVDDPDAVSYGAQQALTEKQKQQARENIGAASSEQINCLFDFEYSPNLLDLSAIVPSALMAENGVLYTGESYAAYCTSGYIPCEPGDTIRYQWTYVPSDKRFDNTEKPGYTIMARICGYDASHNVVSGAYAVNIASYTVPDGVSFVRIAFYVSQFNQGEFTDCAIIIQDDATVLPYTEYGSVISQELKPLTSSAAPGPSVFLPEEICVAVGRTIEIYNAQVCPLADRYHFRWICNVGKALKRKFSITGTESLIGNYDLTLEIYNDAEEKVFSETSTLRIVPAALNDDVSICTIGDSLTNDKYWMNEVQTLSGNKVSFVGTRGTVAGRKHEGRSGFTAASYLAATPYAFENEGVHPFWDGNGFSWAHYKTNTGIAPSAVQIFLGTNDLFGNATPEVFSSNMKAMVDSIRTSDANIPIFVVFTILPGDQNGIGVQQSSDGFASQKGKYKFGLDRKYINAMRMLQDKLKSYANLYFVPLAECHDTQYNFGAVETPVNPRAIQKELMPTEGVHPQKQGYEQIADIMYSVICAKLGAQ